MKRWIKSACVLLLVALLGGCSLAKEESLGQQDRFVGVVFEVIRFSEQDEQLEEGEISTWTPDEDYQVIDRSEDNDNLLICAEEIVEGEAVGIGFSSGVWFQKLHQMVNSTDQGEDTVIEATVYITDEFKEEGNDCWRISSVYQKADGTLYSKYDGMFMSGCIDGSAITLEEKTSRMLNGETAQMSMKVKVDVQRCVISNEVTLYEMDAENGVIGKQNIDLMKTDGTINVSDAAAWILIEEVQNGEILRTALNFTDKEAVYNFFTADENVPMVGVMRELTIKQK